jgi:hypothetical protein
VTGSVAELVEDYIGLRRGLGYRSVTQERALRAFARYLDAHQGPIPLESTLDWVTSTSSTDPRNPARRLATVRGFLRHLSALDGATEVPAAGLLGPTGHRRPPHVYSDSEIADLLAAASRLAPAGGLRPRCYATLFGLLAGTFRCIGLSHRADCLGMTGGETRQVTETSRGERQYDGNDQTAGLGPRPGGNDTAVRQSRPKFRAVSHPAPPADARLITRGGTVVVGQLT